MEQPPNITPASPSPFSTAAPAQVLDGQQDNSQIDVQKDPNEQTRKSPGQPKKVTSCKYIKEEKIAILSVLLEVGMELWEMEKSINKPWRMLFWEQRVALPVREKLKSNARYAEMGHDVDLRFSGSFGVENLRKWVRSQRTQELERVEGERQRMPGSPPGRPLSEVQQLRARVFEEITAASLEKDGEGVGEGPTAVGSGDTQAVAAAAVAAAAARSGTPSAGGGATQAGRDPSPEPFAALFAPHGQNGGSSATVQAAAAAAAAAASAAKAPATISAPGLSTSVVAAGGAGAADGAPSISAGSPFLSPQNGNDSTSFLRQRRPQQPQQQPQPQTTSVRSANRPLLPKPPAVAGNDPAQAGGVNGIDAGGGSALSAAGGTTTASAAAAGVSRPRTASETTPEDFRLGSGGAVRGHSTAMAAAAAAAAASATTTAPPTKRKKVDHTDLVNRVMAQISTLNLPLAATALLVQSLQAKIGSPNFIRGGGGAAAITAAGGEALGGNGNLAQGERGVRGGALSLEERQLLLEERLQASREAESAQALAERRLKLMEEMRAAGNDEVVTDEVLQKQRRVVLGL
ncbi:unnamed protein product [Ectocarpus sp. CCAP 1310/34]|nr:unnamed protein product [Ectocarpus sp. CCAP 1310/34]